MDKNTLDDFFGISTPKVDYKKELNNEQYEAVMSTEGPVLIIAGAGSGKTTTLTYRIMKLIEIGVPAEQILLLTFTNKAAREMISRALNKLGGNHKINGGTYHAFCAKILRNYGKILGFNPDFLIKDSVDASDMLNYLKEVHGYSKEKDFPRGSELQAIFSISINKEKDISWILTNKYPKYSDFLNDILILQEKYQKYKKERNILDYDDLLIYTNKLLRENEEIRRKISDAYKYIMVDEYQDSNKLQFELISLLRSFENKNICVVGDDQQCMIEGTIIHTKKGDKKIENIKKSDEILVSSGQGTVKYSKIEEISKKPFRGTVYKIKTKGGKEIALTGDHTVFAYKKKFVPRKYDTADIYMFDVEKDNEFQHKMVISDSDLLEEIQKNNISDVDNAMDFVSNRLKCEKYNYLQMRKYAKILKECYHFFIPVRALTTDMFICTYDFEKEKIMNDKIVSIEKEPYDGLVYDINVDFYRNYYANGVCVHNCIYGFRGSNHKNILNFPKQFTPCKMIILDKNYRSNQEILDLSNAVALDAKERFDKSLVGTHSSGKKPTIIHVDQETTEAKAILYDIIKRHENGTPFSEMAVLMRASNDSGMLEALITKANATTHNIPYKKFGGIKFMERVFVKDILAYLKIIANERDEISWFRVLILYINIGNTNSKKLTMDIIENGLQSLMDEKHKKKKYGECLPEIYNLFVDLKKKDFAQQLDDIINIYYYNARKTAIKNMKSTDSVIREKKSELDTDIDDAQILIEMAKSYKTASDFLNDITLDATKDDEEKDFLTLSTVHSIKGLEFDTVYVMNCIDNKFPWIKQPLTNTKEAIEEAEEEYEEERRVFYVAITRAKENLLLYVPEYFLYRGRFEKSNMNEFLENNLKYCEEQVIS